MPLSRRQIGLDPWATWPATYSTYSGTLTSTTTNKAVFRQVGKSVNFTVDVTVANAGSGTGFLKITPPVPAAGNVSLSAYEKTTNEIMRASLDPGGDFVVARFDATGNNIATGRRFVLSGTYEAA